MFIFNVKLSNFKQVCFEKKEEKFRRYSFLNESLEKQFISKPNLPASKWQRDANLSIILLSKKKAKQIVYFKIFFQKIPLRQIGCVNSQFIFQCNGCIHSVS